MTARTRTPKPPATTAPHPAAADAEPPRASTALDQPARRLLVPFLLLLFAAQAASSVSTKSATWDETNYFGMGDYLLRNGRWDVPSAVIHPPLAYYLNSLPLLVADLDRSVWTYPPDTPRNPAFLVAADIDRGQALLSSPANRDDRLLFLSRCMVILQAMLLGYFVYRLGAAIYGRWTGVLALALFACCPNMIANGSLITPDMTLAAFFFITIYYLRTALVSDRPTFYVLAGVSLGLALLSKFTAVLLLPIEGVILAFLVLRGQRIPVRWLLVSGACALFVVLLGYGFDVTPYFQGIQVQQQHEAHGHSSFLMGRAVDGGLVVLPTRRVRAEDTHSAPCVSRGRIGPRLREGDAAGAHD